MSASCELTSLEAVKRHLGLSGTEHDVLLEEMIAAASEAIENFCGREFANGERTEYHDGGVQALVLAARPVESVDSVHDDPAGVFADGSLVDPSRYVVDELSGLIELKSGAFARGCRSVRIVYTAGYETPPDDAACACVLLVAHTFHRALQGAEGVRSEKLGGYSAEYGDEAWPGAVLGLLWAYREVRI